MELTAEQESQLAAWRSLALEHMGYMAAVLYTVRPENTPGLKTFAVTHKTWKLLIDFDVVTAWGPEACAEVLLHEAMHLLLDHGTRAADAGVAQEDRKRWNVAADMEINDGLVEAGCRYIEQNGVLPDHIGAERHLTAEEYLKVTPPVKQDDGDGEGEGCGSGAGGEQLPQEGDASAEESAAGDDQVPKPISEAEKKIARISVAAEVKGSGTAPAGLKRWADAILRPPETPWQHLLSAAIRGAASIRAGIYDSTWSRRSRRCPTTELSPGRRAVNAGKYSPTPRMAVVRDTSGSMGPEELARTIAEIESIARQIGIRGRELMILDVDAAVGAARGYNGARSLQEAVGGGGTNMGVGIDAALALHPTPDTVVVVTDGIGARWPSVKQSRPVVACLVGSSAASSAKEVPEWITTVIVKDAK